MKKTNHEFNPQADDAMARQRRLYELQQQLLPQYGFAWHRHNLVMQKVESLARLLHYAELYKKIIDVPGVICEFGVQWGATLTQLINLRSIHEPFNRSRVVYGFDTFEGFPSVAVEDGTQVATGDYRSMQGYEKILEEILSLHESFAPMSHIRKFELIKGDATVTIDTWLEQNPHALISMIIFDMDLYKPTLEVLRKIIPRLVKGSVLVFDELNHPEFPGETIAVREALGTHNLRLRRAPNQNYCSWAVWGE